MYLSPSDLEEIEALASQNHGIKEIALALDVKYSRLAKEIRKEGTLAHKAFQKGLLEIHRIKQENLLARAEDGSETAIQIHNKQARIAAFEDIRDQVFFDLSDSFETFGL